MSLNTRVIIHRGRLCRIFYMRFIFWHRRIQNGPFSSTMARFPMILDILKRTGREVLILSRIIENLAIVDENGPFESDGAQI